MTVLNQLNHESSESAKNTDISLNCDAENKAYERITALAFCSLPSARKKKVREIRQQLIEGKYDIDKRLNIVLDRLIEDLIAEDRIDHLLPNSYQLK